MTDRAGGVRGKDRVRLHDQVELGEDVALEIEVLGHCLDHEVALGEVREVGGEAHSVMQLGLLLLGQLAAGERTVGRVPQDPLAPLESLHRGLDRDDVKAVTGEHLHDARTHGAESDHANCCEVTRHEGESARLSRLM